MEKKKEESTEKEELTLQNVPKAVNYAEILGKTKNVIKKMVRAREIPYYDKGRKIYFFEDELVKWVEESRVKTWSEEYKINKRLY